MKHVHYCSLDTFFSLIFGTFDISWKGYIYFCRKVGYMRVSITFMETLSTFRVFYGTSNRWCFWDLRCRGKEKFALARAGIANGSKRRVSRRSSNVFASGRAKNPIFGWTDDVSYLGRRITKLETKQLIWQLAIKRRVDQIENYETATWHTRSNEKTRF